MWGHCPKPKSQNEYLLTLWCSSTRFLEAFPRKSIKPNAILVALTKFITPLGLPKSIQSDQVTNFMAHAFQQVMNQLGINITSPVHTIRKVREPWKDSIKP